MKLRRTYRTRSRLRFVGIMLSAILLCMLAPTVPGISAGVVQSASVQIQTPQIQTPQIQTPQTQTTQTQLERGRALYQTQQYLAAAVVLEQAVTSYRNQGDTLGEAIALSNLSLVYQRLGRWQEAETAVITSLELLQADATDRRSTLAQVYDVQGQLYLSRGQAETALDAWKNSEAAYEQTGNSAGAMRARLNQAEALQALGLYRRAIDQLNLLIADFPPQPSPDATFADQVLQAAAYRSLGDAQRATGNLNPSAENLQRSLELSEQSQRFDAIADSQLSLANTLATQGNTEAALNLYEQAAAHPATRLRAQLNQVRLLINTNQTATLPARIPDLISQIEQLPPSQTSIYTQINLARSLMNLQTGEPSAFDRSNVLLIAQLLSSARSQAQLLGDQRAESFALGTLGEQYERLGQIAEAQQVTETALKLSQGINTADVDYLWQWQLGRLLRAQGQRAQAIASYTDAVATLQLLRSDLVAINPEVQFSFRQGVEPVYRELVSLLLQPDVSLTQSELELARQTIESLQLAELDNFFREACLNAQPVSLERIDQQAAVLYPIILPDRLEIILSLPNSGIRRYTVPVPEPEINTTARLLRASLVKLSSSNRVLPTSEQLYDWLIRPLQADLEQAQPSTLVFVLDGVLRNIPVSVLYNRETGRYLIENYAIAVTPGLQLLPSETSRSQQFGILLGGLSESPSIDFSDLPGVVNELNQIGEQVNNNRILLNDQFQNQLIRDAISEVPFPVVHLATHGEFSSQLENTFLLTWNDRITINDLSGLLQASDASRRRPIELLVLSACQTAEGDDRAALGLAGVSVRSGARSTIASLWPLEDQVAPRLMVQFYENLADTSITKAEALRQAQISLIQDPEFNQPYFWSAMVLVGNWQRF